MSRMTNATSSSISVMPAVARGPGLAALLIFMMQRLDRPVVIDLDLLDLRAALPRFRLPRILRVEGALLVLDVEAHVELARILQVAGAVELDVRIARNRIDQQRQVAHARRVPEFSAAVDPRQGMHEDVLVRLRDVVPPHE